MSGQAQKRVLIVDDDAGVRGLLCAVLRGRGLAVDDASDGREALDLMDARQYSVIVLDLIMPVLDGFAVLEKLRDTQPHPVVLVLTGADRGAIESLDSEAIHGIVKKPFDPQELATVVCACAEIRGRMFLDTMAIAMAASAPAMLALLKL